ncbi:hypothetical protein BJ508DRAFT_333563 [Ascobolus immersus RN42]|uniref:F-box domain-containing protein n=1 Tax=Ascobolus immersus RN42 TaxID=1160509 RepID=A0A3N4HWD2_ASCIM|nr:hypothetical protein BJ508DRAFT_333563 [Ascobolus immersus RN42]
MTETSKGKALSTSIPLALLTNTARARKHAEEQPFRHTILTLPAEIRLEIYEACSVLSLFVLTQTCRTMYADINTRPHLLKASKGYRSFISRYPGASQPSPHPIIPTTSFPLTIPMLAYNDRLEGDCQPFCSIEVELFNSGKVYGFRNSSDKEAKKRWWCCELCCKVKRSEDFLTEKNCSETPVKFCNDCWDSDDDSLEAISEFE